jgi:hypothetical protein
MQVAISVACLVELTFFLKDCRKPRVVTPVGAHDDGTVRLSAGAEELIDCIVAPTRVP